MGLPSRFICRKAGTPGSDQGIQTSAPICGIIKPGYFNQRGRIPTTVCGLGVKPAHYSEVQLTEAMIEMVKAGLGISVLARWAVSKHIDSGALVARPLTRTGFHRKWSAAMLKAEFTPAYVGVFIDLLSRRSLPVVKPGKSRAAA